MYYIFFREKKTRPFCPFFEELVQYILLNVYSHFRTVSDKIFYDRRFSFDGFSISPEEDFNIFQGANVLSSNGSGSRHVFVRFLQYCKTRKVKPLLALNTTKFIGLNTNKLCLVINPPQDNYF
jgi:hypothetical protein